MGTRGPGLFWMLQTALGLSMAGPMVIVGVEFMRTGRPCLGGLFLVLGLLALFAPSYVVSRIGGPRAWIRRRIGPRSESEPPGEDDA